jgi:hypothetical protein
MLFYIIITSDTIGKVYTGSAILELMLRMSATAAARSKASTVFARSDAEIVCSNLT